MKKGFDAFKIYLVILASMISWFILMNIGPIWYFVKRVIRILVPFIYGGIFAYILNPLNKYVKSQFKNEKMAKVMGVISCVCVLVGTFIVLTVLIVPGFLQSISQIIAQSQVYLARLQELFQSEQLSEFIAIAYERVYKWVTDNLVPYLSSISSTGLDLVGNVMNALFSLLNVAKNLLIGIFVMVYLLLDYEKMNEHLVSFIRLFFKERSNDIFSVVTLADSAFSSFIRGKLLDSLIIGVLCFVLTNLFRIPYALLVSVIVGITNVIPFFGPFIGAIPSALLVLVNNPTKALIFIIIIIVLQQFDGNFLGPKILGDSTGLSPFWVLFSIILCGGLFGIVGMIIGVPLFSILSTLIGVWLNREQQKGVS